ncbi:MAG TPA: sigma-70 family RNA polymerase sigma factor [Actinomycetota bacterium]|nr:sigma-70 family RNA polymerase sigma factor [Actinomycetota bacterium]
MSEPQARTSSMEEQYAANAQRAGRLAYFLVGDRDLAQDLVQEAFLKVFARWGNLREADSFAAYLNRTIVNLAHKTHRRRGVERRYLEKHREPEAVTAERDYETADELWGQLQLLPQRQRTAIVLRYYEDLTDHAAAEAMGCSETAIASLVQRALGTLRKNAPAAEVG